MQGVLVGTRVVEVAQWWMVPAAGAILADWGADVVKVEHPVSGDPQRGLVTSGLLPGAGDVDFMVEQPNRGKRSVGIDLAQARGRELLGDLVRTADVFLTSFLPDARARLGIDVDDLRALNPRLVYVRGHGQGARGPDAGAGGFDAASFWFRGGIANALTAPDAHAPVMQRPAFGDSIAAIALAAGVAGALLQRERTGEAPVVDVSLLGTALWVLGPDMVFAALGGEMPHFGRGAPANPLVNTYRTGDGRWILLNLLQSDRFWPDLCRHLGRPELLADPRFADAAARFEHRVECVAELEATFSAGTLAEWRERLAGFEGVWAPMQTAPELCEDPQVGANGYLPEVASAGGPSFRVVAGPVQFDGTPPSPSPAPAHGQHTEEVLLELGLSWEQIAADKEGGAIL